MLIARPWHGLIYASSTAQQCLRKPSRNPVAPLHASSISTATGCLWRPRRDWMEAKAIGVYFDVVVCYAKHKFTPPIFTAPFQQHSTGVLCQEYFPLKESMSGGWKITPTPRILAPKVRTLWALTQACRSGLIGCFFQLLKKFPILYNYAGQWPIAIMISRHYAMCQCGAKNGLVRSAPGQVSLLSFA